MQLRRKTLQLLLALTLLSSPAYAIVPSPISDLLNSACATLGLESICAIDDLIAEFDALAGGLYEDVRSLYANVSGDIRSLNFERLTEYLPMSEVDDLLKPFTEKIEGLTNDARDGAGILSGYVRGADGAWSKTKESMGEAIQDIVSGAYDKAIGRYNSRRADKNSPAYTFEQAVRHDPILSATINGMLGEEARRLGESLESEYLGQAADVMAQSFTEATGADELTAEIISDPALGVSIPGVSEPGKAAKTREDLASAPSSRVALEVIGNALADIEVNDALYNQIMIEGQKVIAQEIALTNKQLAKSTQTLSDTVASEVAAHRQKIESALYEGIRNGTEDVQEMVVEVEKAKTTVETNLAKVAFAK